MFDVYFILLKEARGISDPQHQLDRAIYDTAWPLHCAHIRAGYYRVLSGPEPHQIFPTPSWEAISSALEKELVYIQNNLNYQAYCILNLCRILYSYTNRDPAVSKQACGKWAYQQFPSRESTIRAALRFYRRQDSPADDILMQAQFQSFLTFSKEQVEIIRGHHPN